MYRIIWIIIFHFFILSISAQQANRNLEDSLLEFKKYEMPQVEVVSKYNRIFGNIPGAVSFLKNIELKRIAALSSNEVFRRIPGIHIVDEEGIGMRMNLGIRGLDPDRSRNVLVLEDGIPVSLGPYGEPELYYSPAIDRMNGVEVLKGSGQIMFGPQTIGGVVNYLTSDPPDSSLGRIKMTSGQNGLFTSLLSYGTSNRNFGIQATYLYKRADRIAYAGFRIHDFSTKMKLILNSKSKLGFKLSIYDEWSDATYIGLTQNMYDNANNDYVNMAPSDHLNLRRYAASVTHEYKPSSKLHFSTSLYAYSTTRNWQRQDFSSSSNSTQKTGTIWGDTSIVGGAIYMRNSNAHRDRQFEVLGVEPRMQYNFFLFNHESKLQVGARYLFERAFEQRKNGSTYNALSGSLVEDEIRSGNAFSSYIHNQFSILHNLNLTVGCRLEMFNYKRRILRNTFSINSINLLRDTNIVSSNQVNTFIPGLGLNYALGNSMNLFTGIHKGFAPPRIKDAISIQGEVYPLNAEKSWNYELGIRGHLNEVLEYELTFFHLDFSNQIIPIAQSAGGVGVGLINGGKTIHQGIEIGTQYIISKYFKTNYYFSLRNNITLTKAEFAGDRFVGNSNINVKSNATPYAPNININSSLIFEMPIGVGFQLTANFTGSQFSDELNTISPSADGRIGRIKAFSVYDFNLYYNNVSKYYNVSISVKNLTDERYISTRRPQGIRLGIPRFITIGVEKYF